jgi:hypothetical protein
MFERTLQRVRGVDALQQNGLSDEFHVFVHEAIVHYRFLPIICLIGLFSK